MKFLENNFFNCSYLFGKWIFGRKRKLDNLLSQVNGADLSISKKELEQEYRKIQEQYTEIRLHTLLSRRIGEYIPRYLTAVEDCRENVQKGILDVFILRDYKEHNSRLSKIMGRHIHIIDKTNIDIWKYTLCRFPKVEFDKYWGQYSDRSTDSFFIPEKTSKYFTLTEEEEKEGNQKKILMGLNGPYVCASSRDSKYLATIVPTIDCHYHDYRDSDINRLNLSADYLWDKGIDMVRMGRYVKDKADFNNCIDYANQYYDELMDIVLMKDCKFYIGDTNGLLLLPMVLNCPVALKNYVPFFNPSWSALPHNTNDLVILKKYYKRDENRFLSVREMMQVDRKVACIGQRYNKLGIEVIENSAEEILDLVMEMNARIDGEWIETSEDIELQKKFQNVVEEWAKLDNLKENEMFSGKIGAMFLRKNPFLLND